MRASRIMSVKRICHRYQLFIYVAILLIVIQLMLALSFYNINLEEIQKFDEWKKRVERLEKAHAHDVFAEVRLRNIKKINRSLQHTSYGHPTQDKPVWAGAAAAELANVKGDASPQKADRGTDHNATKFEAKCSIHDRTALSAIQRAKTAQCRQEIANVFCDQQQKKLFPDKLPRFCPLKGDNVGEYVGCFKDSDVNRLFPGTATLLKKNNSPEACINVCLQTGFQLAGVQFSYECWCGHTYSEFEEKRLPDAQCDSLCPDDRGKKCGGYLTMGVFHTGLGGRRHNKAALVPAIEPIDHKVRVVFALTLNGRAVRQVHRLFKALYHTDHYFFIHVDARQEYLHRELSALAARFPNVRMATTRFSSIWGGASLLSMLLQCMQELLAMKDWHWDFFINLSESDYPIKPLDQLIRYLSKYHDKNFVKSHGTNTSSFIRKQGLKRLFYECDTHLWRVTERELPSGIRIDGGSDWVALNRDFCRYLTTSSDQLLVGLKQYWKYTLLPAESFFHTVLQNSEFCQTVVDNNLHLTNWRRHQGCKCQYRHIVDWCGCSPNDFLPREAKKIMATKWKPLFFARKFEAIINQEVINDLDAYLFGNTPQYVPGLNSYWQSDYHINDSHTTFDDAYLTLYDSFARLATGSLLQDNADCHMRAGRVLEASVYMHLDSFQGLIVDYEIRDNLPGGGTYRVHAFVQPRSMYRVINPIGPINRLKSIEVGTLFDPKEEVFRNMAGLIGPFSDVVLRHSWGAGERSKVVAVFVDPAHVIAASYEITVDDGAHIGSHAATLSHPLRPGEWRVLLLYHWELAAETKFIVTPLTIHQSAPVTPSSTPALHGGPSKRYTDGDFDGLGPSLQLTGSAVAAKKAALNSRRTGASLRAWVDELSRSAWALAGCCISGRAPTCLSALPRCTLTHWSTHAPDPKSYIGNLDVRTGRLR